MIKLIVFDLDGVLVDTKKIHFNSLNKALKKFRVNSISYEDHLKIFDGLPTAEKLKIISKTKKLDNQTINNIKRLKQKITENEIKKNVKKNKNVVQIFSNLSKKYKLAVATNAVKSTLDICLKNLQIKKFISFTLSNEDVKMPKPHPEIYYKIFIKFKLYPDEVLIVEDSHVGRQAASLSGANLLPIKDINETNLKNITDYLNELNNFNLSKKNNTWEDKNLNILIPMAGAGQRFADAGYVFPKPLIEIDNKPMIQWVIESLNVKGKFIFLIQKEHQKLYNLKSVLKILAPKSEIIEIDGITEGAACTTLLAKKFINNNNPLIIANSDQFIKWNSSKSMYDFTSKKLDGAILTFESIHPKWSYAKCDNHNFVTEVAEKKVISKNATVGVYYWKKGSDYVKYAEQMINKNIRVNNEFYVCPVYNESIKDKKKIKIHKIDEMWGLGTPQDLENFNQKFIR